MKEYTVVRCPENLCWKDIAWVSIDSHLFPSNAEVSARAQVCYDDTHLHVHLTSVEKDIRAEHKGLLCEVCEDSCLEFFFSPIYGDSRYFNLECNPNGAIYLGMGTGIHDLVRLVFSEGVPFKPDILRTEKGWELTYAIPHTFVQQFFPEYSPAPGYSMRANFYKCGELTKTPHCLMWNPVPPAPCAAFHQPEHFGILHFA